MTIDRRALLGIAAGAGAALSLPARAQTAPPPTLIPVGLLEPDTRIDLWPGGAPGSPASPLAEENRQRSADPRYTDRAWFGVTHPHLDVFRPKRPNGAAMLVIPGGSYKRVVVDKEGYEIGRWLAARGVTVFVLFYRLPGDGWAAGPDVALSDAQRAMRLIRSRAAEFGVDPRRVGAMGFSAGGHVCADLLTRPAVPVYAGVDAADALPARPLLGATIYPVVTMLDPHAHGESREALLGAGFTEPLAVAHSPERRVTRETPPTFIVHAEDDDTIPVENSEMFHDALRAAGVPVEMHLFTEGGHGFGLARVADKPAGIWPELFATWALRQGLA